MKFLEKVKLGRRINDCLGLELKARMTVEEHKRKFGHDENFLK